MSGPTASVRAMPFSARAGLRVAGVLEEIHEDAKTTKPMVLLEDAEAALARMREEGMAKADQGAASASSLTDRAAVALADSVSTILRSLRLHGTD